ncbi:hypothetical protein AQI88_30725 [Streptomyces cellostaticus]|uniref:Uncharacterized protein n=1 Tax=Streptomyces cellostaticus TaxID=67285 RepID=A0A117PUP0_9ACTN|nr:hypothetical protein [Streptomyces cellostaticus]KUM92558.1 hypothetical protein AQI88_30725 [Streptomyces cellostaticus]GHI10435.1 hypothetical protein Scel_87560 [Streptomyces cellostaticus]
MTSVIVTELDVLGALLAFDFIGFAQKSAALDPTDPHYGQAVGAAFGLAVRRRFPQGATLQEISGYVAGVLGSLEDGAEDFNPVSLERLVAVGLYGGEAPGGEHLDPETTLQARLLLTFRLVRELGLDPGRQRELLAEAAQRASA